MVNSYVHYLSQFTNNNVQILTPTSMPAVDVLIIPNMSALDGRNMHNLPLIDPGFSSFLTHFFPHYRGKIVAFENAALSLYYRMGGDLEKCTGYSEKKFRYLITENVGLENSYVYASIGTNYGFADESNTKYFSNLIKQKNKRVINGIRASFQKNNVFGILADPLTKENLVGSYDYKVAPYRIGDLLTNLLIFSVVNNIKL